MLPRLRRGFGGGFPLFRRFPVVIRFKLAQRDCLSPNGAILKMILLYLTTVAKFVGPPTWESQMTSLDSVRVCIDIQGDHCQMRKSIKLLLLDASSS